MRTENPHALSLPAASGADLLASMAAVTPYWAVEPSYFEMMTRQLRVPVPRRAFESFPECGIPDDFPERLAAMRRQQPTREPDPYPVTNGVAVIDIAGLLTKAPTFWQMILGGRTMPDMARQVSEASRDNAVNAILLRVDSPGGTVAGTSDLADAVYEARRRKPVVAYISDLGASAAYFIASQADAIFADSDAIVGSIGVYLVVPDFSRMAETDGVRINVVRAGEFKGAGTFGAPVTESQLAEFQRTVDGLNETFIDAVARGRGFARSRVQSLNDGRVHVGAEAVQRGLIDGIRAFDDVLAELMSQALGQTPISMTWRREAEETVEAAGA